MAAPKHALDRPPDAELRAGSAAHYEDPRYYADTYADRGDDIGYYVDLCCRRGGSILEYGIGSGRIALPLARCGLKVAGVDLSRPMLRELQRQLDAEPALKKRVDARRGDMRRVRLDRRFRSVLCTFNTFLHLYSRRDVERFCARVREHLARGGRFVLDVSLPSPEELARDPARRYRVAPFRHHGATSLVRYAERFDYDHLRQVLFISMEFDPKNEREPGWMTPLAHRQFFPQELEALLHYNGLEVVDVHGDFERRPPDNDAETLIYICRKRSVPRHG